MDRKSLVISDFVIPDLQNGQNAPKCRLWFLLPENILNINDSYLVYSMQKNIYRPIKKCLVMMLHLLTKKYISNKESQILSKKAKIFFYYIEPARASQSSLLRDKTASKLL